MSKDFSPRGPLIFSTYNNSSPVVDNALRSYPEKSRIPDKITLIGCPAEIHHLTSKFIAEAILNGPDHDAKTLLGMAEASRRGREMSLKQTRGQKRRF